MSTGTTIAIVGGVVAVGAVALIALRPSAAAAAATPRKTPASSGPSAGTLIASLGGSLVSRLGGDLTGAISNLFGSSKAPSSTITATSSSSPASAWNNTSTETFDELAAGDAAMGVEGPF